jgi:hypothetical protein
VAAPAAGGDRAARRSLAVPAPAGTDQSRQSRQGTKGLTKTVRRQRVEQATGCVYTIEGKRLFAGSLSGRIAEWRDCRDESVRPLPTVLGDGHVVEAVRVGVLRSG